MVRFLSLLFLFSIFCQTSNAALVTGTSPSITLDAIGSYGGKSNFSPASLTGTGLNGVFSLYSGDESSLTSANFYPLFKNGVAYQVTALKKAYCFNITATSSVANVGFQFVSATAPFSWNAASITGGVHQGGASGRYAMSTQGTTNLGAPLPGVYVFDSSTYPGVQPGASVLYRFHLSCVEM